MSETHEDSHRHDHEHNPEDPAVFSRTFSVGFKRYVPGSEVQSCLTDWIEDLQQWAKMNKYLIGHIKAFIESKDEMNLWLSGTGGKINAKSSPNWSEITSRAYKINLTAIIFGPKKQTLHEAAQERLKMRLNIMRQQF
jgi:hypothetical protein